MITKVLTKSAFLVWLPQNSLIFVLSDTFPALTLLLMMYNIIILFHVHL